MNHAGRVLEALRLNAGDEERNMQKEEMYRSRTSEFSEAATEKQKNYALQLISMNVENEAEKERMIGSLGEMSKDEISSLIQRFAR
jgi:hypothetical protein